MLPRRNKQAFIQNNKTMSKQLNKALEPMNQHDACDGCGKRTDGLMTCTYSHDDSTTKLCPDCIKDSGFCLGCGHYCSGMESFDVFTDIPGYCLDCRHEIKSDAGEDDDEDDYFNWDGPGTPFDNDFDQEAEDNNPNDSSNL
jgi:hypothetical protein